MESVVVRSAVPLHNVVKHRTPDVRPRRRHLSTVLAVVFVFLSVWPAAAQSRSDGNVDVRSKPESVWSRVPAARVELRAKDTVENTFVPPLRVRPRGPHLAKTATIVVTYTGFSAPAQVAFQRAVDIWSQVLTTPVTIRISATWEALGPGILGSAGPKFFWSNQSGVQFADALADFLNGSDLGGGDFDIVASFNSTFSDWYLGVDGNTPPGDYDLVSVVMHEIGHGLGFLGLPAVDDGADADECDGTAGHGCWLFGVGFPGVFDTFTEDGSGTSLLNQASFPEDSVALGNVLTGMNVYFDGPNARAGNGGNRAQLYAPGTWNSGSSYSHLDETVYAAGNINSLMTPFLGTAEAIHNPGPIMLGIFTDIGWVVTEAPVFLDGFESGDMTVWSISVE